MTDAQVKSIEINGSGRVEGIGNSGSAGDITGARSATINGSGVIVGGTYSTVSIHGSGRVTSDVVCGMLSIAGSGKVQGKVKCENASISGSGTVEGDLKAKTLDVNGSAQFQDNVACSSLDIAGSADIKGNLSAQFGVEQTAHIKRALGKESVGAAIAAHLHLAGDL